MTEPYFSKFEHRNPDLVKPLTRRRKILWQIFAGLTVGLSVYYLHWRWSSSLNSESMVFSILVALAETFAFLGSILFFFDIWEERDTELDEKRLNSTRLSSCSVDVFITTFDEGVEIVKPSIVDATKVDVPAGVSIKIFILDDGKQQGMRDLAEELNVIYISRNNNLGFKAGNLRNALNMSSGDFVLICDADTRLKPSFLRNTIPYFRDPSVAWVQTPHWFYDIPDGKNLSKIPFVSFLAKKLPFINRWTQGYHIGGDPFKSSPGLFFDVIQRRRNRSGSSFCCGAASIHRREAIFSKSVKSCQFEMHPSGINGTSEKFDSNFVEFDLEPFAYHVSEDLFTSIQLHANGWRSVYHPQVEARMLSPWSIRAWSTQKWKYSGGTLDIFFRHFDQILSIPRKSTILHYCATFLGYLSTIWLVVLIFAPVYSLFSGQAPIDAYTIEFFSHLLPVLITNELAIVLSCKNHDSYAGSTLSIATLPIVIRSGIQVLSGERPKFPATPKKPDMRIEWKYAQDSMILILVMIGSVFWGFYCFWNGVEGYSMTFLIINVSWIVFCILPFFSVIRMTMWKGSNAY